MDYKYSSTKTSYCKIAYILENSLHCLEIE